MVSKKEQAKVTILSRIAQVMNTSLMSRSQLLQRLTDPRRDLDAECGYPESITPQMYRRLYDREGLGKRVVQVFPEAAWEVEPEIYEGEEPGETEFDAAWQKLDERLNLIAELSKVDELSGIGRFGVLLLGYGDGRPLDQPIDGINTITGDPIKQGKTTKYDPKLLLYVRSFDESCVQVRAREENKNSKRYGQPTYYNLLFKEEGPATLIAGDDAQSQSTTVVTSQQMTVHWTRVIHVADCRESPSVIYGTPRMQIVFNRIYDVQKVLGGSGEMFWKGAFPGIAIETSPGLDQISDPLDEEAVKNQMELYMNGLQRFIALNGVTAKSLAPQIADPRAHMESQYDYVAVTLGIPKRVLMGSERGELASSQDSKKWNKKVAGRQNRYLTPYVIRPVVDRLQAIRVLPRVESYSVYWPDLNTFTELEKAEVGLKRTEALAKYVSGSVDQVIPPDAFMTTVLEMDPDEVEAILKMAAEYLGVKTEERVKEAEVQKEVNDILSEGTEVPAAPPGFARNRRRSPRVRFMRRASRPTHTS